MIHPSWNKRMMLNNLLKNPSNFPRLRNKEFLKDRKWNKTTATIVQSRLCPALTSPGSFAKKLINKMIRANIATTADENLLNDKAEKWNESTCLHSEGLAWVSHQGILIFEAHQCQAASLASLQNRSKSLLVEKKHFAGFFLFSFTKEFCTRFHFSFLLLYALQNFILQWAVWF